MPICLVIFSHVNVRRVVVPNRTTGSLPECFWVFDPISWVDKKLMSFFQGEDPVNTTVDGKIKDDILRLGREIRVIDKGSWMWILDGGWVWHLNVNCGQEWGGLNGHCVQVRRGGRGWMWRRPRGWIWKPRRWMWRPMGRFWRLIMDWQ